MVGKLVTFVFARKKLVLNSAQSNKERRCAAKLNYNYICFQYITNVRYWTRYVVTGDVAFGGNTYRTHKCCLSYPA